MDFIRTKLGVRVTFTQNDNGVFGRNWQESAPPDYCRCCHEARQITAGFLSRSQHPQIAEHAPLGTQALPPRQRRILRPPILRRISSGNADEFPTAIRQDARRIADGISEINPPDHPAILTGNLRETAGKCPVHCPEKPWRIRADTGRENQARHYVSPVCASR